MNSGRSRGGGTGGGIATPEKIFHHFLIICYYNQYSITTYILSIEDIINEFAANEKKSGIMFYFKLLTVVTSSIVIYVRMLGGT